MIAPVVTVAWLAEHPDAVVVDVRYEVGVGSRRDAYVAGHLPGALFADVDADLAGPATSRTGRHPLPTPESFAAAMRRLGICDGSTIVAYDDAGGAYAARLVWMLRVLGLDAALLDGGLQAYAGPPETGPGPAREPGTFAARPWPPAHLATIDDASRQPLVLDARAPTRYAGEAEPIDARAGHIPGAVSAPFTSNLRPDLTFATPDALARRFAELGIADAEAVVSYCGSGVTACHNLIAMEYAGLGRGRLYPGSWSQYASTARLVATGMMPGDRPPADTIGKGC